MKRVLTLVSLLLFACMLNASNLQITIPNNTAIKACGKDTLHITVLNTTSTWIIGVVINMKIDTANVYFNDSVYNNSTRSIPVVPPVGNIYQLKLDSLKGGTTWSFDIILAAKCSIIPNSPPSGSLKDTADRVSIFVTNPASSISINGDSVNVTTALPYKVVFNPVSYAFFSIDPTTTLTYNSTFYSGGNNGNFTGCANIGDTITRKTFFLNNGSSVFTGAINIQDNISSSSIKLLGAQVSFGASSITLSPTDTFNLLHSGFKYYLAANGKVVDYSSNNQSAAYIILTERLVVTGCLATANVSTIKMSWGCDSLSLCKTTVPLPYTYTTKLCNLPILYISRITPTPTVPATDYYWDSTCFNKTTNWEYLVQNPDTSLSSTAYNVHVKLNIGDLHSYTYIFGDTSFKMGYVNPAFLTGLSPDDSVFVTVDTLMTSDFSAGTIPACIGSSNVKAPVQVMDIRVSKMKRGDKFFFKFKTYQCCPSDTFLFNNSFNINRWTINASCSSCSLADNIAAVQYRNISAPLPLYTPYVYSPNGGAGPGNISTYYTDANADYNFRQVFAPTVNNMAAGETDTFRIDNISLATGLDYQLLYGHINNQFNGVNPQFRFVVVLDMDTGLKVINTANVGIQGLGFTWLPISITNTQFRCTAVFDISTLAAIDTALNAGSSAFEYFLENSRFVFPLTAYCPAKQPKAFFTTSFYLWPRWSTCDTCKIPLTKLKTGISVHCPGCLTPGLITNAAKIERINFGLPDTLNTGLASSLVPFNSSYAYFNQVNVGSSMVGDTLKSTIGAFFVDGDNTSGGVTYKQWQSYWNGQGRTDTFFKYIFLEHSISNSNPLNTNLTLIKDTFYYQPLGTGTWYAIPMNTSGTYALNSSDNHILRISIDQIRAATGNSTFSFKPYDNYKFVTYYTVCGNYDLSGASPPYASQSSIQMYFTPPTDSALISHFAADPLVGTYYHTVDSPLYTHSPGLLNPSTHLNYECEGFGCNNYIYYVSSVKNDRAVNQNPTRCHKQIKESVSMGILGSYPFNNFHYEFRPIPRIVTGNVIGINNASTPYKFTFSALAGCYTSSPVSSYTSINRYSSNAVETNITFYDNTASPFTVTTGSPIIQPNRTFTLATQSGFYGYTGSPNPIANLPIGDEYFSQELTLDVVPICYACGDTVVINDSLSESAIVPQLTACGSLGHPDTLIKTGTYLFTKGHPSIAPAAFVPYAVTGSPFSFTQAITFATDNPDNLYFYIDTSRIPPNLIIDSIKPFAVTDTSIRVGKYRMFKLGGLAGTFSNQTLTFSYYFHWKSCPTKIDSIRTYGIPFYINWSCAGFPSSLPDTACQLYNIPVKDSLTIQLQPALWSNPTTYQDTSYKSCDTLHFRAKVQSIYQGQIKNMFASLNMPYGLNLIASSVRIGYRNTQAIPTIIGQRIIINNIDTLKFNDTISLSFWAVPTCRYRGTAPLDTFFGLNYCGDTISSIVPVFSAVAFKGNDCNQPVIHTDSLVNASCYGDSSGRIRLSVTTGQSPYTYTWNPAVAGNQPSAYHLAPGVYSTIVRGGDSCATTILDTVKSSPACCKADNSTLSSTRNDSLTFNTALTTSQLLSQLAVIFPANVSGTTIQNLNYQIVINNVLTMNGDLTFINCPNITFGQNGMVYNTTGRTLSLISSTFRACGVNMWQGIVMGGAGCRMITQKQTPTSPLSSIQDAVQGLRTTNNASAKIKDCDFVNNWISISLESGYGYATDSFVVVNSKFRTSGTLKYTSQNTTGSLLSDIGIKFTNNGINGLMPAFNVGNYDTVQGNLFDTLNCGINAMNTSLTVCNNTFSHMPQTWQSSQPTYWGRAIYYRTPTWSAKPTKEYFLNCGQAIPFVQHPVPPPPTLGNKFLGAYIAIDELGSAIMDVHVNIFDYTTTNWISVNSNKFTSSIKLWYNKCSASGSTATQTGFTLQNCDRSFIDVEKDSMVLVNPSVTVLPYGTIGIVINSYIYDSVTKYTPSIYSNEIFNAQVGITTVLTDHLYMCGNGMHIKTLPNSNGGWAGYVSYYDKNAFICNNGAYNVDGYAGTQAMPYTADNNFSTKLIGLLMVAQGENNTLQCNNLNSMHWAIAATGASTNPINLDRNIMVTSKIGASIVNNGFFGNVGANFPTSGDNQWQSCTNHLGVISASGTGQKWSLRTPPGQSSAYFPTSVTQSLSPPLTSPPFIINANTSSNSYGYCGASGKTDGAGTPYFSQYDSVALGTVDYASFQADNLSWAREQLIQVVRAHPELADSSVIIHDYIQNTANDPFAELQTLNYDMKLESDSIKLMGLKVYNSQTAPDNIRDMNTKTINDLYLKYYAKMGDGFYQTDSLLPASDLATLQSIAAQCYVTGGPSVFQARSMYWIATNNVDMSFQDNCLGSTGFFKTDVSTATTVETKMPYTFRVYPNPMGRDKYITVLSTEAGEITFYNVLGQVVYTTSITASTNVFDCAQLNCDADFLLYKAKLKNGKMEIGKITIIR